MKISALLMSLFLSATAFANTVCEFPYDLAEEDGVRQLSYVSIDASSRLTKLQKQQVIITAKKYASSIPSNADFKWAINELSENSEGGDVIYMVFKYKRKTYNLVQRYPGGNPYGLVFRGLTPVAARTDGDVSCTLL